MIEIHGKQYMTVAERVAAVHESGKSFQILESAPLQVGDRWLWRTVITVDDKQYVGTAEAKIENARKGSPDSSNPFECAETSALGRALGFAGFGLIDSIASADEIVRSQPATAQPPSRLETLYKRGASANLWQTRQAFLDHISHVLDTPITRESVSQLSGDLLDLVEADIESPKRF